MRKKISLILTALSSPLLLGVMPDKPPEIISRIKEHLHLDEAATKKIESIFASSSYIGQGNPKVTIHPMTKEQCLTKIGAQAALELEKPVAPCTMPSMVPIGQLDGKTICIDRFEFPNIPCEYPLVWTRADQAQELCAAVGKRLCDASEWESACAGEPVADHYAYAASGTKVSKAHQESRQKINNSRKKIWAYGNKENQKLCATDSQKSPNCGAALESGKGVYENCGSNTYPSGAFYQCKSSFGVYDQHGNAAEHMNLPIFSAQELTRNGGSGYTEMKGSWFVFQKNKAHSDDCYWRAPDWHACKVASPKSHHNYHLSFRCCS